MILEIIQKTGITLKKTSSTHGGEWTGPCPACGGRDRFHVWPERRDSKRPERIGLYWCRGCGKAGDAVQALVDFKGMSYREAFAALGIEKKAHEDENLSPIKAFSRGGCQGSSAADTKDEQKIDSAKPPAWSERASALVSQAEEALMASERALEYLRRRGIGKRAAREHRLGLVAEDLFRPRSSWGLPEELRDDGRPKKLWIPAGILIPCLSGGHVVRLRVRRRAKDGPKYYVVPGSAMDAMVLGARSSPVAIVVESELDAIAVASAAGDICSVIATGSAQTMPRGEAEEILKTAKRILVSLDSDPAGASYFRIYAERYPQARPWPVPQGKDPGEAFYLGVDLRSWVAAGFPDGLMLGPLPQKKKEQGEARPTEEAAQASDDLRELADLLRRHPVEIRVAPDGSRVHIRENRAWQRLNWSTSKRISELVFFGDGVLDHLFGLGVEIVNGRNVLYEPRGR